MFSNKNVWLFNFTGFVVLYLFLLITLQMMHDKIQKITN